MVNLSSCMAAQLPLMLCMISKNNDFGVVWLYFGVVWFRSIYPCSPVICPCHMMTSLNGHHRTHYDDSVMKGVGLRHRNSHIHPSHFWGFDAVADKPLIRIAFKFGGRTHCGTPQASPNTCRFLTSWFVGQFVRISKQTAGGIDLKFGGWIHYGIGQAWWPLPGLMNFLQHSAES